MAGLRVLLSSGDIDEYEADENDASPIEYDAREDGKLIITRTLKVPFTKLDAEEGTRPESHINRVAWQRDLDAAVERGYLEATMVECVYAAGMWMKAEVVYDIDQIIADAKAQV